MAWGPIAKAPLLTGLEQSFQKKSNLNHHEYSDGLLCCVLIDKRPTISFRTATFFDKRPKKRDKKLFTI